MLLSYTPFSNENVVQRPQTFGFGGLVLEVQALAIIILIIIIHANAKRNPFERMFKNCYDASGNKNGDVGGSEVKTR